MTVPLVLLHALALSSAMWTRQREALTRLGHRVLAPDQRGYGATCLGAAPPSLTVVADDLARTLDEHGVGEVALAGSSMGGYVAMAFLRCHPGRVRAIALLGTKAGADDEETAAGRTAFAEAVLNESTRAHVVAAALPTLVGATTRAERPEVVEEVRGLVDATPPAAIAWSQRAIAARRDSFGVLGAAHIPGVVIAGAEDELIPVADARQMADAMPRGELVVVPRAGHLTPMEAPGAVTAALSDLLRRAHGRTGGSVC